MDCVWVRGPGVRGGCEGRTINGIDCKKNIDKVYSKRCQKSLGWLRVDSASKINTSPLWKVVQQNWLALKLIALQKNQFSIYNIYIYDAPVSHHWHKIKKKNVLFSQKNCFNFQHKKISGHLLGISNGESDKRERNK